MVELNPAFGDPIAKRFTFALGLLPSVEIQTITRSGPGRVISKAGDEAAGLLKLFRTFDWAVPENQINEDELGMAPDDLVVTLKACTPRLYRELKIGLSQSNKIEKLLSVIFEKEPNRAAGTN